jgi:pimeloyl-ACP methyl ester carboxylesterase
MLDHTLHFKTPAGEAAYLAAYQANLALWPVAHESRYIKTTHGITHLITCGPTDAPPVVLLHAYAFSATEWYANIAALAAGHRVYAVDVMGDLTQTVVTKPFKQRAESAVWLRELLDALGIERTVMIGHSYGGWLTLNFALHCPERLSKMVLLAPAASFVRMTPQFTLRRILAFLMPNPFLHSFGRWCVAPGNEVPTSLIEQMGLAMKHYKFTYVPLQPDLYTDAELSQITTPGLLLIGEHEVLYRPAAAIERATRLMRNLKAMTIKGASHALVMEQPEAINGAILSFIQAD